MIDCRFERAPVVERKKFWHLMPVKRSHTFRRLALQHGGADGKVSECVIVRAHDRSLPLRLKMFFSGNRTQKTLGSGEGNKEAAQDWETPKAVLDIQEAVANLADVLAELWPADNSARIINRVMVLYNFGAAIKGSEQDRCRMLTEFVDVVLRENASRAVVKDVPLSFRQVKERWGDVVEKLVLSGSGGSQGGKSSQLDGRKSGGGGAQGGGGQAKGGVQVKARVARLFQGGSSYGVCFDYNRGGVCNRKPGVVGCEDGRGGQFAHVCNFLDPGSNKFCLAKHSRVGNH